MSDANCGVLTKALRGWAKKNGITPADFSRKTGYSYQHAFNLLRGNSEVTEETLGRILVTYGGGIAAEIAQGSPDHDSVSQ